MAFHNVPPNGFPDIPDIEDLEALQGEVDQLKSGLTNVQDDVKLNTQDLTTGSRTKNLAPFTLENLKKYNTAGTWDGNTYTNAGITWTVGFDSNGNISTITANGTATETTNFETRLSIKPGTYILSGAPADTPESAYYMQMYHYPDTDKKDRGSGVTVTIANEVSVRIRAIIPGAYEVTNVVFKPMVRLSTITDATFEPYIPSVESRIEAVENNVEHIIETVAINAYSKYSDALAHLYTTYNALSDNIKRRCYIKVNDYYIMRNSALNYGHFSRCFLLVNGSNVGTGIEVMALANNVFLRTSLYNDTTTTDFSAQAQTAKLDLCYS